MRRSVFFRSFLLTTCIFVVCFLLFGATMFVMGREMVLREKQDTLHATAAEVSRYVEAMHTEDELSSWELRMNLSAIAQSTGDHIFLCNTEGTVLSSSDRDMNDTCIGREIPRYVVEELAENGSYEAMTDLDGFYSSRYYVVAEPLTDEDGSVIGYVFVNYAGTKIFSLWGGFIVIFVLIAAGMLVVAVAVEYTSVKRLAKPLNEMAEAADRFARGDYSARVTPYRGEDEIGTLTDAFNTMADSLEKNESRRQDFIANVSHELRTPMTSISGFADGILDGTIPPSEEKKYLQKISSESKRLGRLVRSMLDMSRMQDGDLAQREKIFNLGEMVVQTLFNFEERVDAKRLEVQLNMPEDPLMVKGDVDALTRVVYNLLDNAIKFAWERTDLTLSVWKENGKAYTCVQNVGPTIPEEELSLIFDRFHKADRSRSQDREGVGLGLYMVRQILSVHGQDIYVTSKDGITAFTFTLALAESGRGKEESSDPAGTSHRIR